MRIKAAIIGSGNIGTDLVYKARRSAWIEPVWMVGVDPASDGLARARASGLRTTSQGVEGLVPHVIEDGVRIAFDATSAYAHPANARDREIVVGFQKMKDGKNRRDPRKRDERTQRPTKKSEDRTAKKALLKHPDHERGQRDPAVTESRQ